MARRLYTHVDCDNEAAWRLYQQQGFDIYDDAACNLPGDVSACRCIAFIRIMLESHWHHLTAARMQCCLQSGD